MKLSSLADVAALPRMGARYLGRDLFQICSRQLDFLVMLSCRLTAFRMLSTCLKIQYLRRRVVVAVRKA